jgi:DNA-binding response OmpR family regulator
MAPVGYRGAEFAPTKHRFDNSRAALLRLYSNRLVENGRMVTARGADPLILVLEDEAIIGLNLKDELQDVGYRVAGPFTTCADALSWLRTATPDLAILDTVLKDGPCREIAAELLRRTVPIVIYSGHREDEHLLPALSAVTWIEKPVPPSILIRECRQLLV